MEGSPKRLHLKSLIPTSVCKELEFIHKSCGVAGYRPFVLSTTLLHLIATNSSPLIMPFIPIREKVRELVEEFYGCEYELFVEFTGLISWTKCAKIGWHSDNGRPYLKQRHFTAVCYLNSHALDFHGGLFHFQDGMQTTIIPQMGDVLIYRAEDMHCVDEVTHGERCTLALWFTLDSTCDEDAKILNSIRLPPTDLPVLGLHTSNMDNNYPANKSMWMPLPASSSMYIVNFTDESMQGTSERIKALTFQSDLRVARLAALGFEFCIFVDGLFVALREIEGQPSAKLEVIQDALERVVKLKSNGQVVPYVFANSIHALQVLYFRKWKECDQQGTEMGAEMQKENEFNGKCATPPI
eukprot:c9937_g1_i1 orf=141-1202(+)